MKSQTFCRSKSSIVLNIVKISLVFILYLGYIYTQLLSINQIYITDVPNFSDFLVFIFNSPAFLTNPLMLLYIVFYSNIKRKPRLKNILLNHFTNILIYIGIIILAILFISITIFGTETLNSDWSYHSYFITNIPAMAAIILSVIFVVLRLFALSLLIHLIDANRDDKWRGCLIVYSISFFDSCARNIFYNIFLVGVFPSEQTSIFYNAYGIISQVPRVSYIFSTAYWLLLIIIFAYGLDYRIKKHKELEKA